MGMFSRSRTGTTQEGLPVSNGVSATNKRKWSNLMPLFVALVVILEMAFLCRLDMTKNVARVDSWADLFSRAPPVKKEVVKVGIAGSGLDVVLNGDRNLELEGCEAWLEREDAVEYSRDFSKEPVLVSGADQVFSVICIWII